MLRLAMDTERAPRPAPTGVPERSGSTILPDGRRLAWSEWGPRDGAPLLLFHGAPGSSHACPDATVTRDLGVRLIAPDRPGYGDSDPRPGRTVVDWAADVAAMLDHLGIGAAPIVGWSSGVEFALACASALPARVPSLALVAGSAPPDDVPGEVDPEALAARRADPAAARLELLERTRWFAERPESILDRAPDTGPDAQLRRDPAMQAMLLEMFRHAGRHGSDGWVDDTIAHALPWGFAPSGVAAPSTVWFGELDELAGRDHSEHLARVLPNASLRVEPGLGHSLPVPRWRDVLVPLLGKARS